MFSIDTENKDITDEKHVPVYNRECLSVNALNTDYTTLRFYQNNLLWISMVQMFNKRILHYEFNITIYTGQSILMTDCPVTKFVDFM